MSDPVDRAVFSELQATAGAEFVVELVDTFLEEAPQMIAELRAAQAAGVAERFRRAAHSLKTNANTFGATALGAKARELELGGLPGDASSIDALRSLYDAATAALKELARG
ncbi:MAG TPA: Hpt domain-containing protein [Burkholderiaceae bacterium]|nr:Hpt domain-containing protein [Burkholderiaceae bacterium]